MTAKAVSRVHPVYLVNADSSPDPPAFRPVQSAWAVNPPVSCCHPHHHCHLLLLLTLKADTHLPSHGG